MERLQLTSQAKIDEMPMPQTPSLVNLVFLKKSPKAHREDE